MNKISIGIDIGGTNTEIGLVSSDGKVIAKSSIQTAKHLDIELFISDIANEISLMKNKLGSDSELIGIGVGAPNGNFYRGTIEQAPNLIWKGVIPFADMLSAKTNLPCRLTNDANAGALGEKIYGGAKNLDDFIFVTLGTGLGSGFVANGSLIYGHDGFAGELGHTIYDINGRDCKCGRKGCLEQYASASGIVITAYEFLVNYDVPSALRGNDKISSKDIFEAANNGDQLALEIFDYTAKILGFKLAEAVAITSPSAIFLFGGLARSGKYIFEPTKKYMEEFMLNIFKNKVQLLPSLLPESDAAILGASALTSIG